jgi:hypothetical protein
MRIATFQTAIALVSIALGCASFWYLLPRNGRVHPLVEIWDRGSTITIVIITALTMGITMLIAGFFE